MQLGTFLTNGVALIPYENILDTFLNIILIHYKC